MYICNSYSNNKRDLYGRSDTLNVSDCEIDRQFKSYLQEVRLNCKQLSIIRQGIRSGGISRQDLSELAAGYVKIPYSSLLDSSFITLDALRLIVKNIDFCDYSYRGYTEEVLRFLDNVINYRTLKNDNGWLCRERSINQRYSSDICDALEKSRQVNAFSKLYTPCETNMYDTKKYNPKKYVIDMFENAFVPSGSAIVPETPVQVPSVSAPQVPIATETIPRATPPKTIIVVTRQKGIEYTGALNTHECVVCLSWMADTLLLKCGHIVLCTKCAKKTFKTMNTCPVCRETVLNVATIPAFNYATAPISTEPPLAEPVQVESGPLAEVPTGPSAEPLSEPLSEPSAEPLTEVPTEPLSEPMPITK